MYYGNTLYLALTSEKKFRLLDIDVKLIKVSITDDSRLR